MRPNKLSRSELIHTVPRLEVNALLVVLNSILDDLEQLIRLILIDSDIVAYSQDQLANLLFLAVFVVFLVLVEAYTDVYACFGGPCLMYWSVRDHCTFRGYVLHEQQTSQTAPRNQSSGSAHP